MKYLIPLLLCGCSAIQSNDSPIQHLCHQAQDRFNVPDQSDATWFIGGEPARGNCEHYADYVIPKLKASGATNVRKIHMSVAGQTLGHTAVAFTENGVEKLTDNGRGPVRTIGADMQEKVLRFENPFYGDMHNVTFLFETKE